VSSRNILFLESFYGGSHREFADGLVQHSRHRIELHTLPARFWRWRMRGAALHFAGAVARPAEFDLLLVTDLMNVADLKAVWGARCPPIVLYVHENQLSYPKPDGEQRDFQFAFSDIASALAADVMVFNSRFHRDAYFAVLPEVLRRMPEYEPAWIPEALAAKARVLYPGCRLPAPRVNGAAGAGPPLVIWNHRWEFDKQPAAFFAALRAVQRAGVAFEVALLGENAQYVPQEFIAARKWLGERVVQYGYLPSRAAYLGLLGRGSVVVSTAIQENFGISVVEAVAAGCHPLLPRRLAYPEVIPSAYHDACLYDDDEALAGRLIALLSSPPVTPPPGLAAAMQRYSWDRLAAEYDALFEESTRARLG
jgi:glycosyltransferase involved in cell wall biosynthesis